MAEIATLKKINLRDVWQDEGQFSDRLAENLSGLGDELGMELERSEREKAVGPFSADIICVDQISKCNVVIENQFTRTDHPSWQDDHLRVWPSVPDHHLGRVTFSRRASFRY